METTTAAQQKTRLRQAALVLLVVFVLVGVSMYAWHRSRPAEPHYLTATATRGSVAQAVVASGTVNPVTTIQVGTYVSGVIQSISCDFNTRVKAGQLCAKIDPRPYQTAVEQAVAALATARAQVEKDKANLDYAKLVDERNAGLLKRGIVSQETADASHSTYKQAQAQLALDQANVVQREAQLRAARISLGYTDIVSPVDGTVVSRNVTQGQTVAASFQTPTLFLIATDLTRMQVDTNVSESDIGRIAVGNPALFTVSSFPQRQFSGRVEQVRQAPQTIQNVVTYDVVVSIGNEDLALKPGMTASMRIITRSVDKVLRVPDQALRYRPAKPAGRQRPTATASVSPAPAEGTARQAHVWVLAAGKPRRVPVRVGLDGDAWVEISGGELREGDLVILSESAAAASGTRAAPTGMTPLRR